MLFLFCLLLMSRTSDLYQFDKFNLMEVQMRTVHKKKSYKSRKNFEDGCNFCNRPSLKCAYSEIERAEI